MAEQRKYRMTRIEAGDYILPSNDLKTIWRISSYTDGPTFGLDPEVFPRDFTAWGAYRWRGPEGFEEWAANVRPDDLADWNLWEQEGEAKTRREAVDIAIEYDPRPPKPPTYRPPKT